MATVKPFLRKVNTRLDAQPLNVIFTHGRCEVVVPTGHTILEKEFDKKNLRVTGDRAKPLNDLIKEIGGDLLTAYENLRHRGAEIERSAIRAEYETVKVNRIADEKRRIFDTQFDHMKRANEVAKAVDTEADLVAQLEDLQRKLAGIRGEKNVALKNYHNAPFPETMVSKREELETLFEINSKSSKEDLLVTYIEKKNELAKNKNTASTFRGYKSLINLLNRFNPALRIQDVRRETFYALEDFMIGEGMLNQSIEAYMSKIKSILNFYAFDLELSTSYKQYKFELTIGKNDTLFLHPQQLKDFLAYNKPAKPTEKQPLRSTPKQYDRVKDIMLLLVLSGLRINDVFQDFSKLIRKEIDGAGIEREFIYIVPEKTKRKQIRCKIPVTRLMKAIFLKYDYTIKKIDDSYFNILLREMCADIPSFHKTIETVQYCGKIEISTPERMCDLISSHIGRKTFISYQFALGKSIPEIIGVTGHTETNTLLGYAQKTDQISEAVKALNLFTL
jgi:hypothetical protein